MFSELKRLLINFPSVEIREWQDCCEFWFPKKLFFGHLVYQFAAHIPAGFSSEVEDLDDYFKVTSRKSL
jgi:hypothetical protein